MKSTNPMNKRYSSSALTFSWLIKPMLFLSLLLLPSVSQAQEKLKFSIAEFEADPFDLSARTADTEKYDGNGERYAIIKVKSTNPDDKLSEYLFNFGNMNHKVEEHDGVLWIYVQRNAKLVTITRNGYAPINKYDLGTTIESGNNYVMALSSESKKIYPQMVQFNIKPANSKAVVMVKSNLPDSQETLFGYADANGSVAKALPLGSYTYRILAEKYYPSEGRFSLNNRLETMVENIELKSKFSNMTFIVDADADIYINGEKKGTRKWTGALNAGTYQVDCVLPNHTSTSQTVEIVENDNRTIQLASPTPILGLAAITSSPLGANIKIDDKYYGQTPRNIELIIGNHILEMSKSGYYTKTGSFVVKEDDTTEVNFNLESKSNKVSDYTYGEGKTVYKRARSKIVTNDDDKLVKRTDFYAGAGIGYDLGGDYDAALVVPVVFGIHANKFNLEFNFEYCRSAGWYEYDERVYSLGVKLGYGFLIGKRFKLTPQVGYRATSISDYYDYYGDDNYFDSNVSFSIRSYLAISRKFGVSLTPEYALGGETAGFNIKLAFLFCAGF